MPRVHTALADASWSFGSEEKGVGVAAMRDVTARTIPWIPPTDRTGRGRPVDGIMPAGGLTETTRQTTSAEDPSSDAISFCLPIKWRLTACTRYGYPKPTHQCGASGGRGGHARPAEGSRAEPAIAFGELIRNLIYMTACGTDKSDKSVLHRSVFARLLELGSFNLSSAVLPIYSFR